MLTSQNSDYLHTPILHTKITNLRPNTFLQDTYPTHKTNLTHLKMQLVHVREQKGVQAFGERAWMKHSAWNFKALTVKGKVHPVTNYDGPGGKQRCSSILSLTSALYGGRWLTPRPDRFTPGRETRYPFYRRLVAENVTPTGIRSPNHPACSESLYWLCYPGPF